jgi:Bacteriophage Lambda NinG protein.
MPKKSELTKIKERCDKLWSNVVRLRDGRCVICGVTEGLHAHHWIKNRGQGNAARWLIDNGATLCFFHHIRDVHQNACKYTIERLNRAMKPIISDDRVEEIENMNSALKLTLSDMKEIYDALEGEYARIKQLKEAA